MDNDIVEDLLQETDLTLAKAIHKCQAQEAAKKQRAIYTLHSSNTDTIAAFRKSQNRKPQPTTSTCQGCGAVSHPGGQTQCPAHSQICFNCQKVGHFAEVCRSKQSRPQVFPAAAMQRTPHPGQRNLFMSNDDTNHPGLDNIQHVAFSDPAPTINL